MDNRIKEIISEAVQSNVISRITTKEREQLTVIYKEMTGEQVNPNCNACIIKICFVINNKNNKGYDRIKKRNDGRNKSI